MERGLGVSCIGIMQLKLPRLEYKILPTRISAARVQNMN